MHSFERFIVGRNARPASTRTRLHIVLALVSLAWRSESWGADEFYRPSPREVYGPETYCNWNRTGLPPAQQKTCADRDRRKPPAASEWQTLEADNGARFKVDLATIQHFSNGSAGIVMYEVGNGAFSPANYRRLHFDCRGNYMDDGNFGVTMYAPPKSVVGRIQSIACSGAKNTAAYASPDDSALPSPAQYCEGFDQSACTRIRRVVEAKQKPAYCRPGYGRVDSGLTNEQRRICSLLR